MTDFDRNSNRGRSSRGRYDRGESDRRGSDRRGSGSFGRRDSSRGGSFDRNDRPSRRPEMHKVVCDKCGKDCEVPFKPTHGKPIYCDNCFKDRSRESGSRSEMGKPIDKQSHDEINRKLDKILKILNEHIAKDSKSKKVEEKPKKVEDVVDIKPKKVSKKIEEPVLDEPVLKKEKVKKTETKNKAKKKKASK